MFSDIEGNNGRHCRLDALKDGLFWSPRVPIDVVNRGTL
jgi:hypothetical protein